MLIDRTWKLKYTPDDADLVQLFSMPALTDAVRHDRLTSAEPGQRTANRATAATPLALYLERFVVDNEPRRRQERADRNRQPSARGDALRGARTMATGHAAVAFFGSGSFKRGRRWGSEVLRSHGK